jgi:hypothetical protein
LPARPDGVHVDLEPLVAEGHDGDRQTTPPGGSPNPPQVSTITAAIAGTQSVGGLECFIWSESAPSNEALYLHRSDTELLLAGTGQPLQVLIPPARLLMLPPAAGQTWQVTSLFATTAPATVTAETVTVGSAQYDAMKVHIAASSGDYLDLWFAPQVGPVEWKRAVVQPGVGTTVTELDLQSYSLP